ncbi:hypothetical protein GGF31_000747 [Allomyces arbusculus]|nr:hypothetical protein GGF31_000747 [Allomyces arbusculus]
MAGCGPFSAFASGDYRMSFILLAALGVAQLILDGLAITNYSFSSIVTGAIISLILIIFKMLCVITILYAFYQRNWSLFRNFLGMLTIMVIAVVILAVITLGTIKMFGTIGLVLEILFVGYAFWCHRTFSKSILP